MRILQLISSGGYYGAENMLVNLVHQLRSRGFDIVVGVFENTHRPGKANALQDELKTRNISVEMIPCEGKIDLSTISSIRSCVEKHAIDVVHSHGYKADIYGYFALRKLSTPIVATCHNWPSKSLHMRLYSLADRILLRKFDKVAAVSDKVAGLLRRCGVPTAKVEVIDNGIDIDKFADRKPTLLNEMERPGKLLIGTVGRLVRKKGYEYLLKAIKGLENPNLMVVLVGDGPERKSIEELAGRLGISENVRIFGYRPDMPEVYASLDIVVLPSLDEGLPLTVLEAMAAKRAIVATDVGAVGKAIIDGQTGLLVRPAAVEPLRDAIAQLVANSDLRAQLGTRAQRRARERFSASAMAKSYAELYDSVLSRENHVRRSMPQEVSGD
jgi:glycosyltransferase involved in cell wall biosynthesis